MIELNYLKELPTADESKPKRAGGSSEKSEIF